MRYLQNPQEIESIAVIELQSHLIAIFGAFCSTFWYVDSSKMSQNPINVIKMVVFASRKPQKLQACKSINPGLIYGHSSEGWKSPKNEVFSSPALCLVINKQKK